MLGCLLIYLERVDGFSRNSNSETLWTSISREYAALAREILNQFSIR